VRGAAPANKRAPEQGTGTRRRSTAGVLTFRPKVTVRNRTGRFPGSGSSPLRAFPVDPVALRIGSPLQWRDRAGLAASAPPLDHAGAEQLAGRAPDFPFTPGEPGAPVQYGMQL